MEMAERVDVDRLIAAGVYAHQRREVEALLRGALGKYGEPRVSLKELRATLREQLKGRSLSELVIAERSL